jgi:hypothetical protein
MAALRAATQHAGAAPTDRRTEMAAPFPTPSGPERDAAFRPPPESESDDTSEHRRGGGDPAPGGGEPVTRRSSAVRAASLGLTAVGALLIFPVDALVGGTALETVGVILAVVGIAGALASGPARPADPPTGR